MDSALVGLFGVIVGATVTGLGSFLLARRSERSERRAAARLLCTDLHKVLAVTAEVRATGSWGAERDPLPTRAFDTYDSILARELPPVLWKRTEGSVLGVLRIEGIRAAMLSEDRPATAAEVADIVRICAFIEKSLEHLDAEAWAIDRSDRRPDDDVLVVGEPGR